MEAVYSKSAPTMNKANRFKRLKGLCKRILRGDRVLEVRQSEAKWNEQFARGSWNFLLEVPPNIWYVAEFVKDEAKKHNHPLRILDVGCGNGALPKALKEIEVNVEYVGIDISEAALKKAREVSPHGTYILGDMEESPNLTGGFDIMIFAETLYYGNAKKILRAYQKNTKPKTLTVITFYKSWRTDILQKFVLPKLLQISHKDTISEGHQRWNILIGSFLPFPDQSSTTLSS